MKTLKISWQSIQERSGRKRWQNEHTTIESTTRQSSLERPRGHSISSMQQETQSKEDTSSDPVVGCSLQARSERKCCRQTAGFSSVSDLENGFSMPINKENKQ